MHKRVPGRSARRSRGQLRGWLLALAIAGTCALVTVGLGQSPTDGLRQRESELRSLKAQIEEKRRKTEQLRREGKNVEQLLGELERQRGMTERYLGTLSTQADEIEREIAVRQEDLAARTRSQQAARTALGQALLRYYKERRITAAELLLSARSFSEVFARAQYWVRAIRTVRQELEALERQRAEMALALAGVDEQRRQVQVLKQEREEQLAHLEREKRLQQEHRSELQGQIAIFEEQARKLAASQREIERLIEEAQRAAAHGTGGGLANQRGALAWPVAGTVIGTFGTQIHPRYGTQIEQKGIDIAADEGTAIRAVAEGKVVFEGWLEGYGRTVILDHGGGYFTLYAHASETLVQRGRSVRAGETIARVGSSDSIQGSCLHFEIRKGSQALDPAAWLKSGGGS